MKRWTCQLCHASNAPHRKRDICDDCQEWLAVRALAWCTRGKHRVAASQIPASRTWCYACERKRNAAFPQRDRSDYRRAWYAAHPGANKRYQDRNREQYNAARREKYWQDPGRYRAQSRASYQRHRARKLAYARMWRARNPDLSRANARLGYQRQKLRIWRRAA